MWNCQPPGCLFRFLRDMRSFSSGVEPRSKRPIDALRCDSLLVAGFRLIPQAFYGMIYVECISMSL